MSDWYELLVISIIVVGIVVAVWRGGSANPESTGSLGRKITAFDKRLSGVESGFKEKLSGVNSRLSGVESELKKIERDGASIDDIALVRQELQTLRAEIAGDRRIAENTLKSVQRIEQMLMQKGMGQ